MVKEHKLTAAAQEILAVVERTLAGYEEETSALRERQRRLLELLLQPRVTLCRTDVEEEGSPAEEEEGEECAEEAAQSPGLDQEAAQSTGLDQEAAQSAGLDHEAAQSTGLDQEAAQRASLDQEAAQSTGLDQEALTEPGQHVPDTRLRAGTQKRRLRKALTLRVCLLKDSQTKTLLKGVLKSPMKHLRVPRGLQEADFLDLLRSTFPQLIGPFDAFTTDATRKLTPLAARSLMPEEIRRSIRSSGKGRSALYVRVKAAKTSLTSTEQLPVPQQREQEAARDTGSDVNREGYGR
ncbi:uncharacterized protein LOC120572638 [Perca fluviatilis]|uniref:uncharacterized protein LOC120572638 n=1 Tax=Perca fluviatilis TaxID=8168 RepID=UPI001966B92B|nr:uncharacterized protein LOC120572638 [Perca fluviatilis]